jgi:hypothetical protein
VSQSNTLSVQGGGTGDWWLLGPVLRQTACSSGGLRIEGGKYELLGLGDRESKADDKGGRDSCSDDLRVMGSFFAGDLCEAC